MNKEKGKKNILVIILPIVIALLVIIIGAVLLINASSPLKIYRASLDHVGESINAFLKDEKGNGNTIIELEPQVSNMENKNLEKIINKVTLKVGTNYNADKNQAIIDLVANYSKKELLNVTVQSDKNTYLFLNNLYSKPIKLDFSEVTKQEVSAEKMDKESIEIVVNKTINAINKSFKKEYFTKGKETITLNGKKEEVKVITFAMNKNQSKEFYNSVKKELINDKEYVKAYAKITGEKETKVKKELNNIGKDYSDIKIKLYTKGLFNEVVGCKVINDKDELEVIINSKDELVVTTNVENTIVKIVVKIVDGKKTEYKDVNNAVDMEELDMDALSEILKNFKNQPGYSDFNSDIKSIFGVDMDQYINLMLSY